jgi:hemoglobin/transferrin/lactoferrin receptor protein
MNFFKAIYLLSIFAIPFSAQSQQIVIKDITTKQGISYVFIYDSKQKSSTLTNQFGTFDKNVFPQKTILVLQHPSYRQKIVNPDTLSDNTIWLHPGIINLQQVTITANKWEQQLSEVPNKIIAIKQEEIQLEQPQTTADLLAASGKVFVQKSQQGGGSPMLRGFAANSVLLVLDGIRMNNLIYRSGNLQNVITVDANSLAGSEIILGPGSMIYGSDALGGVMDFHSLQPAFTGKPGAVKTNTLVRTASANHEKTFHIDMNYEQKKWASLTSLSYSDYDDLRMGSYENSDYQRPEYVIRENGVDTIVQNNHPDVQKFSGYSQFNLMQKVTYRPSASETLDYGLYYSTSSNIPRYDRLLQYEDQDLKYAAWYYGPQDFLMNLLRFTQQQKKSAYDRMKISLAHQWIEESRHDRKFQDNRLRSRTESVNTYNFYLDFEKTTDRHANLFYGAEAIINTLTSTAFEKDIETGETQPVASRYPDGDNLYQTYAMYALYKNNVSNHLTLQTGLRYSHILMKSTFDNTSFYPLPYNEINFSTGALSGSFGTVYRPGNQWEIHVNGATGFRAPNVDDMAKIFDSEPGEVIVPNENLRPEYSYNADLTVKKLYRDVVAFETTLFYTYLDNAMVRRDFQLGGQDSILYDGEMSRVSALVNAGYANIFGGSFYFKGKISEKIQSSGQITYTSGADNDGYPLRHVAPLFAQLNLTYQQSKFRAKCYIRYNGKISYENLALSERDKPHMYSVDDEGNLYSPAWWTLNLKVRYQLMENVSLHGGVENLLDVRYRPYSSGIAAAGRNLMISVRGSF